MKKTLLFITIALTACNSIPVHVESGTDWTKENIAVICGVGALAGLMIGIHYVVPKLIDAHVEKKLLQVREGIKDTLVLNTDKHYVYTDAQRTDIISKLAADKKELENKWKMHWSPGIKIMGSASFGGTFSIANAIVFSHLLTTGQGILKSSISLGSTELNGNTIVESCRFSNEVIVKSPVFTSFNHCLLGKIKVESAIIELVNSVVEGDIVFECNDGIIIIDKHSIVTGSIVRGNALYV